MKTGSPTALDVSEMNYYPPVFGQQGGVVNNHVRGGTVIGGLNIPRGTGHLFVTGKNPVLTGKHAQMTGFSRHLTGKFQVQSLWVHSREFPFFVCL